jgi:urease accessory protein
MARVVRVLAAGHGDGARPVDSVTLGPDRRRVQDGELIGTNGTHCVLDLPAPITLRMGDALELEGGGLVEIVIEAEHLIEARGRDLVHLAKLAWHLGDRHVPVQILSNRLRLRRDAAIETLLGGLGARLTPIEAPFDPEGGAYAAAAHHHQGHGHGHDHTGHGHAGHRHDHDTHDHHHHTHGDDHDHGH